MRKPYRGSKASAVCEIKGAPEPQLHAVVTIYNGSDGDATKAMYDKLTGLGTPLGTIAVNVFRAQKNSARAKVYRGGGYKGMAYDRKNWAMDNLTTALAKHGEACGIGWGWRLDPAQAYHSMVLYVDLPTGQVSFHTRERGAGPDYGGDWDGIRGQSPERVCRFVARVLVSAGAPIARDEAITITTGPLVNGCLTVHQFRNAEEAAQGGFPWAGR